MKKKIFDYLVVLLMTVAFFGGLAPAFVSAADTLVVVIGILLTVAAVVGLVFYIVEQVKYWENESKK